jgi:prepilin-type N-terminal cleavage/methylation domain-containing protein
MTLSMKKLYSKKSGFTLVELLVVILIIGVLVGITFTGANFLFSAQEEKQAASQIEALSLALEQYKSEMDTYPNTDSEFVQDNEFARGTFLYLALAGQVDSEGEEIKEEDRGKSFLPGDSINLGMKEGNRNEIITLSEDELMSGSVEVFPIDPWLEPYIYEYPRKDGHKGFLLFSKGPDGESSAFDGELTATPKKQTIDEDNIPTHEPGKW